MKHVHLWSVFEFQSNKKDNRPMLITLSLLSSGLLLFSIRVLTARSLVLDLTLMHTLSCFIKSVTLFYLALSLLTKTARVWWRQIWSLTLRSHLLAVYKWAKLVELLCTRLMLRLACCLCIRWVLHLQLRIYLSILLIKELVSVLVALIIRLKLIRLQMRVDLIFILLLLYSTCMSTWLIQKACV